MAWRKVSTWEARGLWLPGRCLATRAYKAKRKRPAGIMRFLPEQRARVGQEAVPACERRRQAKHEAEGRAGDKLGRGVESGSGEAHRGSSGEEGDGGAVKLTWSLPTVGEADG